MSFIINNTDSFNKGYFINNPEKKSYNAFPKNDLLFLTQQDNIAIKTEILNLIQNSYTVIKICSFILTDTEIFDLLMEKVKKNKIALFILTQLDSSKLKDTNTIAELLDEDEETSAEQHMRIIKRLYDKGAHVRAANVTHAKFLISDRKTAFVTSANLTTPSLNLNTESGIYLNENDAKNIDKLFDIIYQKGTEYKHFITANKRKNLIVQSNTNLSQNDIDLISRKSGLRFTYQKLENGLYNQIINIIQTSQKYLYISSYCIVNIQTLDTFKNALEEALNRNVKVLIFCRGMNYRDDHLESCEWLVEKGCRLFGDIYNHSKGIANEETGMIFTANIDGRHGLINGFEVGCILNNDQRNEFVKFHESVIAQCDYIFQTKPIRKDFLETYLYYQNKKGIKYKDLPTQITINSPGNDLFPNKEVFETPIFYAEKENKVYLIIGNELFLTEYQNGVFEILEKCKTDRNIEKQILYYDTLTIN